MLHNPLTPKLADAHISSLGYLWGNLLDMCRIRRISCDYTFNDQCLRLHPPYKKAVLNTNSGTGHRYTTLETVKE